MRLILKANCKIAILAAKCFIGSAYDGRVLIGIDEDEPAFVCRSDFGIESSDFVAIDLNTTKPDWRMLIGSDIPVMSKTDLDSNRNPIPFAGGTVECQCGLMFKIVHESCAPVWINKEDLDIDYEMLAMLAGSGVVVV